VVEDGSAFAVLHVDAGVAGETKAVLALLTGWANDEPKKRLSITLSHRIDFILAYLKEKKGCRL